MYVTPLYLDDDLVAVDKPPGLPTHPTEADAIAASATELTRAALPVMHAQRDGHIIQISSIGGRRGTPGLGAYQSAKWAVGGFSEVWKAHNAKESHGQPVVLKFCLDEQ